MKKAYILFLIIMPLGVSVGVFTPSVFAEGVASRTDGSGVLYYTSLHDAVTAAADAAFGKSIEQPDKITLLADLVLNEPFIVDDGIHIKLVAGDRSVTIRRGENLIEYPVIWVRGENASLHLREPGMEFELFIDGGYLDSGIQAHAPLIALSGPDAKLFMYDKVFLQNNFNNGNVSLSSYFENGGGVIIRTAGDLGNQQAQFTMKGGTIRGNTNAVPTYMAYGGGVQIVAYGIFLMEGGVIMNNTANVTGGGVAVGGRGTFKKTGGIIYGKNAPAGFRNIAVEGVGSFKTFGHAVRSAPRGDVFYFRNDTVKENDNISYTGISTGDGVFGDGDKWDNSENAKRRKQLFIILSALALAIPVFMIVMRSVQKNK
jgi:hypothetical protein